MNTKDKLNQLSNDFSLVLNDSGADLFHSARDIVRKLSTDETHTIEFIACILHDRDYNELGDKKTLHYHLVIKFQNRFRVGSIINYIVDKFHCNANQVQIEKCIDIGAQARYLIHLDNREKTQYRVDEVFTNNSDTYNYYLSHLRVLDERDLINIIERFHSKKEIFLRLGFKQYSKYSRIINDLMKEW